MAYHTVVSETRTDGPVGRCRFCGDQPLVTTARFCRTCGAEYSSITEAMYRLLTWPARLRAKFRTPLWLDRLNERRESAGKGRLDLMALGLVAVPVGFILWQLLIQHKWDKPWGFLAVYSFIALLTWLRDPSWPMSYFERPRVTQGRASVITRRIEERKAKSERVAEQMKPEAPASAKTTKLLDDLP